MNRRDFLKKSALAAGVVAGSVAVSSAVKPIEVEAKGFGVKEHKGKTIYDVVEMNDEFGPFYWKDTIFSRKSDPVKSNFFAKINAPKEHEGFDHNLFNYALAQGSNLSNGDTTLFYKFRKGQPNSVDGKPHKFKDKKEASYYIKRAAKFYKATDVGIAPYDANFMYVENIEEFKELGFKPKSIVVMCVLMNHDILKLYPTLAGMSGAWLGYSNMAEIAGKLGVFISELGYSSYAGGNEWGMAVPLAISAGLGEGSRMGTLIHPELGTGFRIVKVFTELELEYDSPITFGVEDFCNNCKKCADNCPSGAIYKVGKAYADGSNISTRKGIKKWATNSEKCYEYWGEVGNDCGRCITVCPYFKNNTWVHKLSKVVASTPGVNNVARYMDDMFGYGKLPTEDTYKKFWENIEI